MTGDLERYLYHSHQGWPVYETQTPSSLTGEAMMCFVCELDHGDGACPDCIANQEIVERRQREHPNGRRYIPRAERKKKT